MNDLQVEAFLEVVRMSSFSKAGERLFVPQPTLTHRIKQLEDEIGEKLLFRKNKRVSLTPAGKLFLPYARQIHESMKGARRSIENIKNGVSGVLSIGASAALSQYVLPSLLETFLRHHSQFRIDISAHPSDEVIRKLQERKISFGLTRHRNADPDLQFDLLHQDPVHLIAGRGHPLAKRRRVSLEEACREPVFIYQSGTYFREFIEQALINHDLKIMNPLEINHPELIKSMVKASLGITFLPGLYVQEELSSGELVSMQLEGSPFPPRSTFVAYPRGDLDAGAHLFLDYARDYFAKLAQKS